MTTNPKQEEVNASQKSKRPQSRGIKEVKLTRMQSFWFETLWLFSRGIAALPHAFRYRVLAPIIYFLLYHVTRYRRRVVRQNLEAAFPHYSNAVRRQIARDNYRYLSEVFIGIFSMAGNNPEESFVHHTGDDMVSLHRDVARANSIVMTAHQGFWEYMLLWGDYLKHNLVGVYRPLGNPIFDALFMRLRSRNYVTLVPLRDAMRFCFSNIDGINGEPFAIGLIADQTPPKRDNATWYNFLNQDTQFFDGGEKLALRFKMPVCFVYQRRYAPGHYQFVYEMIYDGVGPIEEGEITARYVEKLERVIKENPHLWLWSHRRWKHKRNPQNV